MTAPAVIATEGAAATYGVGAAVAARDAQLTIRASVMLAVLRLWPLLDRNRLAETFPGWLQAMQTVVTSYHGQSAQAAATFYRAARAQALQSPTPVSLIKLAPPPDPEWMAQVFGFSGPGLFAKDTAAPGTALSTTLGSAARVALQGGRATTIDTAHADPAAVGWYRVTDGDPCAFCAMLAGRGIVYRKDTVGFKAHDQCGCTGAPAFSRKQQLPELSSVADDVYTRSTANVDGKQKLVAFRKAWADHQAGRAPSASSARTPSANRTPNAPRPTAQVQAELAALEKALPAANAQQSAWLTQRIETLRAQLGQ